MCVVVVGLRMDGRGRGRGRWMGERGGAGRTKLDWSFLEGLKLKSGNICEFVLDERRTDDKCAAKTIAIYDSVCWAERSKENKSMSRSQGFWLVGQCLYGAAAAVS